MTAADVDFDKHLIRVTKTLHYAKRKTDTCKTFFLGPPKTKSSKREVPMTDVCENAIKNQMMLHNVVSSRRTAKPLKGFENLLFTTKFATPINSQIYSDSIKKIVNEINLCRTEFEEFELFSGHCFRHTFATRCFESNIKYKTVQKYLGHKTLKMTVDLYTHVLPEHLQDEMFKLDTSLLVDDVTDDTDDTFEEYNNSNNDNVIYLHNV